MMCLALLWSPACYVSEPTVPISDSEASCYLAGNYSAAQPDAIWDDIAEDFRAALSSTPGPFLSMVYYGNGRTAFALSADCTRAQEYLEHLVAELKNRNDTQATLDALEQLNSSWSPITQESYERGPS
jgi:hypothetical protein